MSSQPPRVWKNAHSHWDGNASVSAVLMCLDALVQEPLTEKTAANFCPKREVTVVSLSLPRGLSDQKLESRLGRFCIRPVNWYASPD